jgi:hypothetical protein
VADCDCLPMYPILSQLEFYYRSELLREGNKRMPLKKRLLQIRAPQHL